MSVGGTAAPFRPHPRLTGPRPYSFGRRCGRRRLLVGESGQAKMDDGCDHGADDRDQTIYQASPRLPVTIIGPSARAELKAAPVSGPPVPLRPTILTGTV